MIAFIIGAPRSGTTIVGRCLDLHPDAAHFYEPYYIWDYFSGYGDSDLRTAADVSTPARQFIRRSFQRFAAATGKPLTIDKLPENAYRVDMLDSVFPEAKYIHLLRDGRDVTLSINKEWRQRAQTVERRDYRYYFFVLKRVFQLQPYWRFRLLQIFYELKTSRSVTPHHYLNKSKWQGKVGWGPRFPGWQKAFKRMSLIEFNALQWVETVRHAQLGIGRLPASKVINLRYETFIRNPIDELKRLFTFLGYDASTEYINSLPKILANNTSKWAQAFSADEIRKMGPVLSPMLVELGYEMNHNWYQQTHYS
jgi:hypothetical protein